jgi:hypothetical protein
MNILYTRYTIHYVFNSSVKDLKDQIASQPTRINYSFTFNVNFSFNCEV